MFNIPNIEKHSYYIDNAMDMMQKHATKARDSIEVRYEKK